MRIEINPHGFVRIPSTGTYLSLSRATYDGGMELREGYSVLDKMRIAQRASLRLPTSRELSEAEKYFSEIGDDLLPRQSRKAYKMTGKEAREELRRGRKATSTFLAVRDREGNFPEEVRTMLEAEGFNGRIAMIEGPQLMSELITKEAYFRPSGNSYVLVSGPGTRIVNVTGKVPVGTDGRTRGPAISDYGGIYDDNLGIVTEGGTSPEDIAKILESGSIPALGQSNGVFLNGDVACVVWETVLNRLPPGHDSFQGVPPEIVRKVRYVALKLSLGAGSMDTGVHFASNEDPVFWAEKYEGGKSIDMDFVYQNPQRFSPLTLEKAVEKTVENEARDKRLRGDFGPVQSVSCNRA